MIVVIWSLVVRIASLEPILCLNGYFICIFYICCNRMRRVNRCYIYMNDLFLIMCRSVCLRYTCISILMYIMCVCLFVYSFYRCISGLVYIMSVCLFVYSFYRCIGGLVYIMCVCLFVYPVYRYISGLVYIMCVRFTGISMAKCLSCASACKIESGHRLSLFL